MFQNYLKIIFRNIWRNKIYSAINLVGLAIALTCCLLIFLYVRDEVSFDRFHTKFDRIYRVNSIGTFGQEDTPRESSITQLPLSPTLKQEIPEIEAFVRFNESSFLVRNGNIANNETIHQVESNFLQVFDFALLAGNPKTILKEKNNIVLTEAMARKYFGTTNIIGKTILLEIKDKFESFIITGIAQNPPFNSSIRFDFLLSFQRVIDEERQLKNDSPWLNSFINNFIVLKPNADVKAIEKKFPAIIKAYTDAEVKKAEKDFNEKISLAFKLQAFSNIHVNSKVGSGNGMEEASSPVYSFVLSGIAVFILLIACINFTNLSLAQSLPRAKEIGVRKVIGATKPQLIFQFLVEALLLCFLAMVLGLALAELALPIFNQLANKKLAFNYLNDFSAILASIGLLIISALLAGIYPALILSRFEPIKVLKGKQKIGQSQLLTRALVVAQFALSAFLIIVMLVFARQMNFIHQKYLGYEDKNLIRIQTGWGKGDKLLSLFKNELKNNPKIVRITGRSGGVMMSPFNTNNKKMDVVVAKIDEEFLQTLQIKRYQGRNFDKKFPSDSTKSVLVNEAFVKKAGLKNPLQAEITADWDKNIKLKIVGVFQDFNYEPLYQAVLPTMLTINPKYNYSEIWVRIQPQNTGTTMALLEQTWKKFEPYRPFNANFMEIINRNQYEQDARWQKIVSLASGFAIFISIMGLFGLATLNITQRTKEIGIRKVLGASIFSLVFLLSYRFTRLVLIGILIAMPLAYYVVVQFLQNYAYRTPFILDVFVFAGVLTFLIAFLAIAFQSIHIARRNPVDALRYE